MLVQIWRQKSIFEFALLTSTPAKRKDMAKDFYIEFRSFKSFKGFPTFLIVAFKEMQIR
jgi:hypothetical protein